MAKKRAVGLTISAVASKYQIHPQTLRTYEREGLLKSARTQGNTRFYREKDFQRLELILTLTRELGVNLAGVEVVLHMREKMTKMYGEVEKLIEALSDPDSLKGQMQGALVRVPPLNLMRVIREPATSSKSGKRSRND